MRAYQHPMATMSHNQQLGFLDSLKDWGQGVIDDVINDPAQKLLESAGLSQEEIQKLQSETTKELNKQAASQVQDLIASVTGTGKAPVGPTQAQLTITNLQNQIKNLTGRLAASVPGGQATLIAVGGILVAGVIYTQFIRSPKAS